MRPAPPTPRRDLKLARRDCDMIKNCALRAGDRTRDRVLRRQRRRRRRRRQRKSWGELRTDQSRAFAKLAIYRALMLGQLCGAG